MSSTLLIFSFNNPLDSVALSHIVNVFKSPTHYTFHLLNPITTEKKIKEYPITQFITNQLTGYGIEVTEI